MGAGASTGGPTEGLSQEGGAAAVAELIEGALLEVLSPVQRGAVEGLSSLLKEPGWRRGNRRNGVAVHFKFSEEAGLYYVCSSCTVPDTARSMWEDFNQGRAQERYSDICSKENILQVSELAPPLGHERLVQGIYKMPSPMKDRDFIWHEWSALVATQDGGELYVSMAQTPSGEAAAGLPQATDQYVRGHLHVAATLARQAPGDTEVRAASIILGDVRGSMPKQLQNMVAGNASSYLANFRNAHATKVATS